MWAIVKREWNSFFSGMMGYVLTGFLLFIGGLYFTALNLQGGYAEFGLALYQTSFAFLVFIPILTMRSFSEERRARTDQLLLTSPVSIPRIVLGKYLAMLGVFAVPLVILAVCPVLLAQFGAVNFGMAYASIFAYFLLGAAAVAIGMFLSSLTESQIIAAVGTFAVLLLTYMMQGIETLFSKGNTTALVVFAIVVGVAAFITGMRSKSLGLGCGVFAVGCVVLVLLFALRSSTLLAAFYKLLDALALFAPFQSFIQGLFSLKAVVYYLSIAALFLFLTGQTLEKRRWN